MATFHRQPDFVASHVRLEQRVRNLETGVHPTTASVDYYDSHGPEFFLGSVSAHLSATTGSQPTWMRRTGVVYLYGAIHVDNLDNIPSGGTRYCYLPAYARPNVAQRCMCPIATSGAQWTTVRIGADGEVRVFAPPSVSGAVDVYLTTISYPFE